MFRESLLRSNEGFRSDDEAGEREMVAPDEEQRKSLDMLMGRLENLTLTDLAPGQIKNYYLGAKYLMSNPGMREGLDVRQLEFVQDVIDSYEEKAREKAAAA